MRMRSLLLLLVWMAACGDDSTPTPTPRDDAGQDTSVVDMAPDVAPPDDAGLDTSDAADDTTGPSDIDLDGIQDTDDNCPDVANADQADRDRDGLGDACDHLPFVHAPDNPMDLDAIDEDAIPANDTTTQGAEYNVSFPLKFTGSVDNAVNNQNDFDLVTFTVDRPTALLIHIESPIIVWPSAILLGTEARNNTITRVAFGDDVGQPALREVFLPLPGEYSFVLSDFRNFLQSTTGNVGGLGYDYTLWVSQIPLPEPVDVNLPTAAMPNAVDGTLKTYRVRTPNLDALRVYANGVSIDDMSFHFPAFAVMEADGSSALAHTSPGQVNDNNRVGALLALNGRDEVLVVEDYVQRFKSTQASIEFQFATLFESETDAQGNEQRESDLPWLVPGAGMQAVISEPRAGVADEDYYLFVAKRGHMYRVAVIPDPAGAALQPEVEVGAYFEQGGSYYYKYFGTDTPRLDTTTTVEYFFASDDDGEACIRVAHGPNGSGVPQGGAAFGYTIELQEVAPLEAATVALPGSASKEFESGGIALFEFEGMAGQVVRGSLDDGGRFLDARLTADDGRTLTTTYDDFTYLLPADGTYRVDARDYLGRGSLAPVSLYLATFTPATGALPISASGIFDAPGSEKFYALDATEGQRLDLRTQSPNGLVELGIYDETFTPIRTTLTNRLPFLVPADGRYYVGVSPYATYRADYAWTFAASLLNAMPVTLPFADAGVLDTAPYGRWYNLPVAAGKTYEVNVSTMNSGFAPRLYAYTESLGFLDSGTGTMRFTATANATVYVHLYDATNSAGADFDYALNMRELNVVPLAANTPTTVSVPSDTLLSLAGIRGFVDIRATSANFTPILTLLRGTGLDALAEARSVDGRLVWGDASNNPLWLLVEGGTGDVEVTLQRYDRTTNLPDAEPNDRANPGALGVSEVRSGSVGGGDNVDAWDIDLQVGQRAWISLAPLTSSVYAMSATLTLEDLSGNIHAVDTGSGDGNYPAIYGVDVPTSGTWRVVLASGSTADYVIYFAIQ